MFRKQQTKIYTKENLGLLQWVWQYQSYYQYLRGRGRRDVWILGQPGVHTKFQVSHLLLSVWEGEHRKEEIDYKARNV